MDGELLEIAMGMTKNDMGGGWRSGDKPLWDEGSMRSGWLCSAARSDRRSYPLRPPAFGS